MKRSLMVAAALALLTIPVVGSAAPAKPGAYVSGYLGVNVMQTNNATVSALNSPSIDTHLDFDPSISVGGAGGYNFGYLRVEGEFSYKHGEISSVSDNFGNSFTNLDGSLSATAFMGNGFIDLHNDSPLTPYFGGGIGFATVHLTDTIGTQRGTVQRSLLYYKGDDTVFAYQVGGGVEFAINHRVSLDFGYRYFATDVAKFNDDGSLQETSLKFQSHSGIVGARVKF